MPTIGEQNAIKLNEPKKGTSLFFPGKLRILNYETAKIRKGTKLFCWLSFHHRGQLAYWAKILQVVIARRNIICRRSANLKQLSQKMQKTQVVAIRNLYLVTKYIYLFMNIKLSLQKRTRSFDQFNN